MTGWIEPIALWLADFYLAATQLLVCVVGILLVVKQPARRMAVGWGTLVSLLLAAVLCQSSSRPRLDLTRFLHNTNDPVESVVPPSLPIAADIPKPAVRETADSVRLHALPPQIERRPELSSSPFDTEATDPTEFNWKKLGLAAVVCTFLAGTCLMATWLSIGVLRAVFLVRHSRAATGTCVDALKAIVGPAVRPPRLGVHRSLLMPVATGTFRPVILLPEQFAQAGRLEEIKAVLAHEWAHVKNGDLWLLAIDRIVLTLLWAHPLYWWIRRRLRTDRELLADAAAAAQMGAINYAALLVDWARKVGCPAGVSGATAIGVWEQPGGLAQRVTVLLNHSEWTMARTSGRTRFGIVVVMALVGSFAAMISLRPTRSDMQIPESPKVVDYHIAKDEVGGLCLDRDENRLSGANVTLYIENRWHTEDSAQKFIGRTITNDAGQFIFQHVPQIKPREEAYFIVARRRGMGATAGHLLQRHDWLDFTLRPGFSVKGTVNNEKGRPLAGALVRSSFQSFLLPEGEQSTRTDATGNFELNDLSSLWECSVSYPGYLNGGVNLQGKTSRVQVTLKLRKASQIEGQVVDGETDQPASGVTVTLRRLGFDPEMVGAWGSQFRALQATTDSAGRYTFPSLPAGKFNLSFRGGPPGLAAAPIDSLATHYGETTRPPLIRLTKGGIVAGRLIEHMANMPISVDKSEIIPIAVTHPSGPTGKNTIHNVHVRDDDTFEVWVPPGKNSISLAGGSSFSIGDVQQGIGHDVREIDVKAGQEYSIKFRVFRIKQRIHQVYSAPSTSE